MRGATGGVVDVGHVGDRFAAPLYTDAHFSARRGLKLVPHVPLVHHASGAGTCSRPRTVEVEIVVESDRDPEDEPRSSPPRNGCGWLLALLACGLVLAWLLAVLP